jgi:polysaccharide export outer membrane protein
MKKTLLLSIFCLTLILIFNIPQICFSEEVTSTPNGNEPAAISKDSYRIGSGDILEITTWKEPDFSRPQVLVRNDGKITFPLLGDIEAAGKTPLELKNNIEESLKDYVDNPIVTVTVVNPGSQKFYILGEVARTGEYNLTKKLTILQALALAGGFSEWAKKNEIILLRYENGKEKITRVSYKKIIKGKDLTQNILIKANDTIIVP